MLKQFLHRRLSPREVVVGLAAAAVLAGLIWVTWNFIAARLLESRVQAAVPKLCAQIRSQQQTLISAIEAYKAHFGFYPPDHVLSQSPLVVDAVTNWLVYELVGVTYDPTNHWFRLGGTETADAKFVKDFFHCDGFTNCADSEKMLQHFLPPPPGNSFPLAQFHDDPDVYVLAFSLPYDEITPEVGEEISVSPWRYVCSAPIHNPGKFDLWIELQTKNQSVTVGNWKATEEAEKSSRQ